MQQHAELGPALLHQATSKGLFSIAAYFVNKGVDATECLPAKHDRDRSTSTLLLLIEASEVRRYQSAMKKVVSDVLQVLSLGCQHLLWRSSVALVVASTWYGGRVVVQGLCDATFRCSHLLISFWGAEAISVAPCPCQCVYCQHYA